MTDKGTWGWIAVAALLLILSRQQGCDLIGGAAPFAVPDAKQYVLVVSDTTKEAQLTEGQRIAMNATKTGEPRDLLKDHFRLLDETNDPKTETAVWQAAYAAVAAKYGQDKAAWPVPIMCSSNGSGGFLGPLPKTHDEILALVKQYQR